MGRTLIPLTGVTGKFVTSEASNGGDQSPIEREFFIVFTAMSNLMLKAN